MSRWVRGEIEVTSFTLVWIKMPLAVKMLKEEIVTSFTLVWIKMAQWAAKYALAGSHELHARVD